MADSDGLSTASVERFLKDRHEFGGTVVRHSLPRQVAERIGRAIVGGEFAPGRSLPGEIELTRSLGVSRTVLREALTLLAGKGLIAARPKSGTSVRPRGDWNMLDVDVLAWRLGDEPTPDLVDAWFDFRARIEPFGARLAALRATDTARARIAAAYAAMEAHRADLPRSVDSDIAFHQAVLEAGGNEFLTPLGRSLESALRASFLLSSKRGGARDAALALHEAVVAAIDARDADRADAAMTALIEAARQDLLWVVGTAGEPHRPARLGQG